MRLTGVIVAGVGDGARFLVIDWVRAAIRAATGFEPYPGTLNLRLTDPEACEHWRAIRGRAGARLTPPDPATCGGWLVPARVEGGVPAVIVVPDVTSHPDDLLEVVAPVHLRAYLGRGEGEAVTLEALADTGPPG